ncbi:hypothetical protein [Gemmobacter denitrificans]|uniref:Uncharacterized protein n=1 Tax=Gemmobacter denitrificans TaxID=3123040 RepID=A0ABU8BY95_9RHOB
MTLINQPTLRPTRKMAAVGWTSLLGPIVAAIIAPWLPGLPGAATTRAKSSRNGRNTPPSSISWA